LRTITRWLAMIAFCFFTVACAMTDYLVIAG
jgi:hypothetical protein